MTACQLPAHAKIPLRKVGTSVPVSRLRGVVLVHTQLKERLDRPLKAPPCRGLIRISLW